MADINLEHISTIPATGSGYELVSHSITITGDVLFLYVKKPKFKIFASKEKHYKILRQGKNQTQEILLPPLNINYPLVDLFSDGSILIVNNRCQYRGVSDYDLNGIIYNPDTKEMHKFLAGDGIAQASIDHKDNIWISYFDEGVFGNYGWGNINTPEPIGQPGVNCFDSRGILIWSFDQTDRFIDDCYAMNVTPNNTYLYYYSDFDFCTISDDFVTSFLTTELSGCHAFAISGENVLFTGQYQEEIGRAYLVKIGAKSMSKPQAVNLKLSHGESFTKGSLIARSKMLHLFTKTDWYSIDARKAYSQL